ncbi:hypothetical protein TWF481_002823 [Arthrobotrys musiformis]|uniref:Uncharacterized protein n=1 Tax=Arthrobotrys musiformis TaxID=47236 RepID=A0AAV9VRC7_9PEZI
MKRKVSSHARSTEANISRGGQFCQSFLSDNQSPDVLGEPATKRHRGTSNRSKGSPEAVIQTEPDNIPEPQLKFTFIAAQTAPSTQISRRFSPQHSQPSGQHVISPEMTRKPQIVLANPPPTFPVASRMSIRKWRLEEKPKALCNEESPCRGIILCLETENARHVEEKLELRKKIGFLQKNVNALEEEGDNLQHQINVAEQDLAGYRTAEKHLRHNESVTRDCCQRHKVEYDKLKQTTDLEAEKSKDALEKSQQVIAALQSELSDKMTEIASLRGVYLEGDSIKFLEGVLSCWFAKAS